MNHKNSIENHKINIALLKNKKSRKKEKKH